MTMVAAGVSPSPVVLHSVIDLCAFIDELADEATGELVFGVGGASAQGAVFVEDGRVCWAAARGLARRLTDILAASANLDAATMESLYGVCQRQQVPLGEYLVSKGLIAGSELRRALLKHTTESLHELCAPETVVVWLARRGGGYSPRFTFGTSELLSCTCAETHRALADRVGPELSEAFTDGDWGAAFVCESSHALPEPIAISGPCPDKIMPLISLGHWACCSLALAGQLDEHSFLVTVLDEGAVVAWRSGPAVIAGSTSVHGPARLLNRRARARRKEMPNGGL